MSCFFRQGVVLQHLLYKRTPNATRLIVTTRSLRKVLVWFLTVIMISENSSLRFSWFFLVAGHKMFPERGSLALLSVLIVALSCEARGESFIHSLGLNYRERHFL